MKKENDNKLDNNEIYKYQKTGNLYYIINDSVKSKQVVSGEWVECVLYKAAYDGKLYTREKNDFYKKFDKIN